MDTRTILAKIVTLIYKTRLLGNLDNDDLIRTILSTIKTDSPEFNFLGNNLMKNFKDACIRLLEEKDAIPGEVLTQQMSILLENDQKLLAVVKESVNQEFDDASNKRVVTSLIKTLTNYYKEHLAIEILSKVTYDLKFNRNKITNFSNYLQETIAHLEPLASAITSIKDPSIVNEIDFENPDSISAVFEEVRSLNDNTGIYRLGWQGVNKMLQGGIRRGETVGVEALQHRYKTGTSLTIFAQIALHNKPIVTKEEVKADKKPLLLRISYEDNLTNNMQFIYQYIKAYEGSPVAPGDFEKISADEMTAYVVKALTATGFRIKMLRIDPNQSSYTQLFNKIIELEAQGYAIHVLGLDYLLKLPTTGCTQGILGSDKRDLVRRVRNFCSARNIAFISPYQLSTEANQLLRNGVPDHQFLHEVAEKNYTDSCKTIGQELDLELYVHIFTHKRKKYLAFKRGKHRITSVISDEDKFCMYRFPGLNIPVLGDIDGEDTSFQKLPKDFDDGSNDLLGEVLS